MLKSFKMSFCSIKYTAVISYSDVDGVNHDYHLSRVNDSCFSDKFKTFVYTSVNRKHNRICFFVLFFNFCKKSSQYTKPSQSTKYDSRPVLCLCFLFFFQFFLSFKFSGEAIYKSQEKEGRVIAEQRVRETSLELYQISMMEIFREIS